MDVTRSEVVPAELRLLEDGSPVTGATIVLDIRRAGDGFVVDWADSTLKALGSVGTRYLSVPQVSATDHPGLYLVNVNLGTMIGVASSGDVLVVTYYEQTAGPTYTPLDEERWRVAAGEPLPTPEVIEVGQSEDPLFVFNYTRNGVPVTGATVTFTTDRLHPTDGWQRYDWDIDTFVAPAAATSPTVPMIEVDATYAPGAYWWEWAWTNPTNNIFPTILWITIYDGATVLARREIRVRTVDTINAIAAFGAPPSAPTISAQVAADLATAHGVGNWVAPATVVLADGSLTGAKIGANFVSTVQSGLAVPGSAMTLTAGERTAIQAKIIDDGTPFHGASIASILAFGAPPTPSAISTQVRADLITDHGAGSWAVPGTLATSDDVAAAVAAIEAYGQIHWQTAVGFAVPGDAMTLANGALTSAKIGAGFVNAIQANLALEATLTAMKGASFDGTTDSLRATRVLVSALPTTAAPSASDVATEVWAETEGGAEGTLRYSITLLRKRQTGRRKMGNDGYELIYDDDNVTVIKKTLVKDIEGNIVVPGAGDPAEVSQEMNP